MSTANRKGRDGENPVVAYLREHGWPHVERRRLHGRIDLGDITGTPGLAWEIRNRREIRLRSWLKDAAKRAADTGADHGLLVWKPDGMGEKSIGDWPVILRLEDAVRLLRAAGYGDQP